MRRRSEMKKVNGGLFGAKKLVTKISDGISLKQLADELSQQYEKIIHLELKWRDSGMYAAIGCENCCGIRFEFKDWRDVELNHLFNFVEPARRLDNFYADWFYIEPVGSYGVNISIHITPAVGPISDLYDDLIFNAMKLIADEYHDQQELAFMLMERKINGMKRLHPRQYYLKKFQIMLNKEAAAKEEEDTGKSEPVPAIMAFCDYLNAAAKEEEDAGKSGPVPVIF